MRDAKNDLPDLSRTAAAIAAYDEAEPRLRKLMMKASSNAWQVLNRIERLAEAVGIAFGEDTRDRNNPATCRQCIRPGPLVPAVGTEESFVRRMVKIWLNRKGGRP